MKTEKKYAYNDGQIPIITKIMKGRELDGSTPVVRYGKKYTRLLFKEVIEDESEKALL